MKNILKKYGHDSRLYSGEVELSEFDTEPSGEHTEGSYWAKKIIKDWMFDNECDFILKAKKRGCLKDSEASHPWKRFGGMYR